MMYWLAKQEPDGPRGYHFDQLRRDGTTVWDGVHNNLALKHMGNMKRGDLMLYYHTGKERRAVGIMKVARGPYPNPDEPDKRFIAVDVKYVKPLKNPVPLSQFKQDPAFADWELIRISRLSVMPVPQDLWRRIMRMSGTD